MAQKSNLGFHMTFKTDFKTDSCSVFEILSWQNEEEDFA